MDKLHIHTQGSIKKTYSNKTDICLWKKSQQYREENGCQPYLTSVLELQKASHGNYVSLLFLQYEKWVCGFKYAMCNKVWLGTWLQVFF
jgi:hypothetical protein